MVDANKSYQIDLIIILGILLSITSFSFEPLMSDYAYFKETFAQIGHGHNLPPSIIGDREISLNFNN